MRQDPLHVLLRFIFVIANDFCFWIVEKSIEGGSCGRATSEVEEYLFSVGHGRVDVNLHLP